MSDVYPYHSEFRLKLASLVLDPLWTGRVGEVIKPAYFDTDAEQDAVAAMYEYRERYKRTPLDVEDVIALVDNPDAVDVLYSIYEVHDSAVNDMDMPKDVAIQWAKEQAAKIAILESIDDVRSGDLTSVLLRIQQAVSVGDDVRSPGIDFIRDVTMWLYNEWVDRVPTGWVHIDNHLEGGLGGGELGVVFAPTNRGKSVALVNIAYAAAGIGSAKDVLILTHEMSPGKYAKRIAARMMFRFPSKQGDLHRYEDELLELAIKLLPGRIRIAGGAQKMGVNDIRDIVNRLHDEDFHPSVIIDDYADLLIPPTSYSDKRHNLTATYEWLRSYAGELDIPIWTASQVGRQAYTREVIRVEDVAEDIGKANTADLIVAICQTPDEALNERCRLYLAKARDVSNNKMYDAKYYTDSQAIITIGETERREIAEAI